VLLLLSLQERVRKRLLQRRVDQPLEAHGRVLGQHGAADIQAERLLHLGRQLVANEAFHLQGDAAAHLVDVGVVDSLLAPRRRQEDHKGVPADHDLRDVIIAPQGRLLDLDQEGGDAAHQ